MVVEAGEQLLPREVKAAANPGYSDTRGLRAFREEYRGRFAGGLLLHGGAEMQWLSEHILAVPWWRLLEAPLAWRGVPVTRGRTPEVWPAAPKSEKSG